MNTFLKTSQDLFVHLKVDEVDYEGERTMEVGELQLYRYATKECGTIAQQQTYDGLVEGIRTVFNVKPLSITYI